MMLTPQKLRFDANALSRSLLTPHPGYADGALAMHAALADLIKTGRSATGVWIRTNERGKIGYLEIKDEVSGQYCRTLPEGVSPTSVIEITVDPYLGEAEKLLNELIKLIKGLADGRIPKICGTRERIEIQEMPQTFWSELGHQLFRVQTAIADTYNASTIISWSQRLQPHLFQMVQQKDTEPLKQGMEDLGRSISELRSTYAADATLAAWVMIYRDLCHDISDYCEKSKMSAPEAASTYVRYVAFGAAPGGVTNPIGLLFGLVDKTAREGLHEISATIAERYFDDGMDLIEEALGKRSLDEFGATLYKAGPLLFAATRIFKGLIEGKRANVPESTAAAYAKRANVAEEQAVRVNTSLLNMVENRTGYRWQRHQARVNQAQSKGPAAVGEEVLRIIEQNYFYPRCWEQSLVGDPTELPSLELGPDGVGPAK